MLGALEKIERSFERRIRSNSLHSSSDEFLPKFIERRRRKSSCSSTDSNNFPSAVIVVRQHSLPSDVSSESSLGSHGLIGSELNDALAAWIPSEDPALMAIPVENPDLGYAQFLQTHCCYDAMPHSNKVLVFDTQLAIRKAFYALCNSQCRTALLKDNASGQLVGLMSVTDFMRLLLRFHTLWKDKETFESGCDGLIEQPIGQSLELLERDKVFRCFLSIDATESLLSAAQKLTQVPIHRLPVLDAQTGNPLFVITHRHILEFLHQSASQLPKPSLLFETPRTLNVGTWTQLHTVSADTTVLDCIRKLFDSQVSACPVVCGAGRLLDVFSRFDATQIIAQWNFEMLSRPVSDALHCLAEKSDLPRRRVSCLETEPMMQVVSLFMEQDVHRIIVVNAQRFVQGVITASDVVRSLVLRPVDAYDADLLHDSYGLSEKSNGQRCMRSIPEENDHIFGVIP